MTNSDLCPACGEYRLPKIPEGSRMTGRCCQACLTVFPVTQPREQGLTKTGCPDLDNAKKVSE